MPLVGGFVAAKHVIGAAMLVSLWPSRRYMRRLRAEAARAERRVVDLRHRFERAAGSAGDVAAEVAYWLELVRAATTMHDTMPRAALVDGATPHQEMAKMLPAMAAMSPATRGEIERTLLDLLDLLGAPTARLRLVAPLT